MLKRIRRRRRQNTDEKLKASHSFRVSMWAEWQLRSYAELAVPQIYDVACGDNKRPFCIFIASKPKSMSYEFTGGYKIRDQGAMHFLTFTIEGWIDIFSRQCYRDIVLDSFRYCQKHKGLKVGAYVIMSNHIHVIWTPTHDNLSDIVRDFKTFTSKALARLMLQPGESRRDWLEYMFTFYANRTNRNEMFKLWTNDNHPEAIYTNEFLLTKLNYIHNNPVRAGLVRKPEDYVYSSASNYAGMGGIFEVDLIF